MKRFYFILGLLILTANLAFAQKGKSDKADTVYVKEGYLLILKDSTLLVSHDTVVTIPANTKYKIKKSPQHKTEDFYSSLGDKSEKNWITRQLYDVLVVESNKANKDTIAFQTTELGYEKYKGWRIGKISYKQVEIFAGNVDDTLQTTNSKIIKVLNNIKSPTRLKVLKKNTIIQVNDVLEPSIISDNERLLRELPYIVESRIYAKPLDSLNKVVELVFVTQDQFSIGIEPSFSSFSKFSIGVYDRNAFGTGSELGYTYAYEQDTTPVHGTIASYRLDNIGGAFINGLVEYRNVPGKEALTIDISKRFITPETQLGGGFTVVTKDDNWLYLSTDTVLYIPYSGNFFDVWTGYSPQIFSQESRKQMVFSGRYYLEKFRKRPLIESDSNQQFANNQLLIGSASFRRIKYKKSRLLVGFGRAEDVPIGEIISFTAGYNYSELQSMPYLGVGAGVSRFTRFGIWGLKADVGGFINHETNKWENGALSVVLNYYSPLYLIKKFTFRTSFKLRYLNGISLPSYKVTNINDDIRGISGTRYYGQDKLAGSFETVSFTPWYVLGFRFALYAFADIGFLGYDNLLLDSDHFYSGIGVGVRLRNENLVIRTIQLRLTFYNLNPENAVRSSFDISTSERYLFNAIEIGKPDVVQFQ